ncbi:MAG: hypothetical protein JWR35_1974 [Marmoricola sp.]|jgi:hypothetical protein|nr:hypothetical protein [Marmoricola sp.]
MSHASKGFRLIGAWTNSVWASLGWRRHRIGSNIS